MRAAHDAVELPKADFKLGDQMLGTLDRGDEGDYVTVEPGSYDVMATRPGSDDAVISKKGVSFAAGTASTVYAVGSGGEQARFVVVQDAVDAPEGGPATGLGGLSDDGSPLARRAARRARRRHARRPGSTRASRVRRGPLATPPASLAAVAASRAGRGRRRAGAHRATTSQRPSRRAPRRELARKAETAADARPPRDADTLRPILARRGRSGVQ